jgi:hypothetical protein
MGRFFKKYIFEFEVLLENGQHVVGKKTEIGTIFSDFSNVHDSIREEMRKNVGSKVVSFVSFKTNEV